MALARSIACGIVVALTPPRAAPIEFDSGTRNGTRNNCVVTGAP
jgi:hypothetical protein